MKIELTREIERKNEVIEKIESILNKTTAIWLNDGYVDNVRSLRVFCLRTIQYIKNDDTESIRWSLPMNSIERKVIGLALRCFN